MNWTGANWKRSYGDLGGEALALLDGVTLRRLVDGDWAAARATPGLLAGCLAIQAKARRRPSRS